MRAAAEMMMVIERAGIAVVMLPVRIVMMIRMAAGFRGMMTDVGTADVRSEDPGVQPDHHAKNHQPCEKLSHQFAETPSGTPGNQGKNPCRALRVAVTGFGLA